MWKIFRTIVCTIIGLVIVGCLQSEQPEHSTVKKIGIYDSRSVTLAYAGSKFFKEWNNNYLKSLKERYDKAKTAGDKKLMAELEAEGKAQQERLHKQTFSTAPVDDILAHISDKITEIKQQAGIDMLVSKWDKKTLAKYKSAEQVDVTIMLVDAFEIEEKQRQQALDIQQHKPISLKQAERIKD